MNHRESRSRRPLLWLGGLVAASGLLLLGAGARRDAPRNRASAPVAKPAAARLAYDLAPGSSHRYNITAIFTGHFPPFTQPDSPPITLKAQLAYVAHVKKQDDKGAEVEFVVDSADVSLLEKEPGPDGKSDPNSEVPFPLPLSQVQEALNVTATLRPDGSVASVSGGNAPPVKIDLGFDLRKLFLLILPVTFPDRPVAVNDSWNFADGFLGNKPGKVSYTGQVAGITAGGKNLTYRIRQNAEALIDDKRDKEGKVTENAADAVDTTTGKVTVTGDIAFLAPATPPARKGANGAAARFGRLTNGQLVMNALLTRKRTVPDPNKPEEPLESKIDVKARLLVQAAKPATQPARVSALPKAKPPVGKVKENVKP